MLPAAKSSSPAAKRVQQPNLDGGALRSSFCSTHSCNTVSATASPAPAAGPLMSAAREIGVVSGAGGRGAEGVKARGAGAAVAVGFACGVPTAATAAI